MKKIVLLPYFRDSGKQNMSEFCLISQLKIDLRFSNARISRTFREIDLNFRLLRSIEICIRIMASRQNSSCYSQKGHCYPSSYHISDFVEYNENNFRMTHNKTKKN